METVSLANGQTVSYASYGAAASERLPLIHLHGASSSRLEAARLDDEAARRDIRLIAPDRPGCGGSDPNPALTVLAYATDVAGLADALGFDRFVLSGHSNGGMFAMAAAHRLPTRVAGVIAINSTTPTFDSSVWDTLPEPTRVAYQHLRDATRTPEGLAALVDGISGQRAAALGDTPGEAFRQLGSGYLESEIRLAVEEWGFDHTAVAQPVAIVSGDADAGVSYARRWAELLPAGSYYEYPGGHGIADQEALHVVFDAVDHVLRMAG